MPPKRGSARHGRSPASVSARPPPKRPNRARTPQAQTGSTRRGSGSARGGASSASDDMVEPASNGGGSSGGSGARQWSQAERTAMRAAVVEFGEHEWDKVVARMRSFGRTGEECRRYWRSANPVQKGAWAKTEDALLSRLVQTAMAGGASVRWSRVAGHMPGRNAKQCRERWVNNLDPDVNKGPWTADEDRILLEAQRELGNKWSDIAKRLPGRPDNAVKNRWYCMKNRQWAKLSQAGLSMMVSGLMNPDSTSVERMAPALTAGGMSPEDMARLAANMASMARIVGRAAEEKGARPFEASEPGRVDIAGAALVGEEVGSGGRTPAGGRSAGSHSGGRSRRGSGAPAGTADSQLADPPARRGRSASVPSAAADDAMDDAGEFVGVRTRQTRSRGRSGADGLSATHGGFASSGVQFSSPPLTGAGRYGRRGSDDAAAGATAVPSTTMSRGSTGSGATPLSSAWGVGVEGGLASALSPSMLDVAGVTSGHTSPHGAPGVPNMLTGAGVAGLPISTTPGSHGSAGSGPGSLPGFQSNTPSPLSSGARSTGSGSGHASIGGVSLESPTFFQDLVTALDTLDSPLPTPPSAMARHSTGGVMGAAGTPLSAVGTPASARTATVTGIGAGRGRRLPREGAPHSLRHPLGDTRQAPASPPGAEKRMSRSAVPDAGAHAAGGTPAAAYPYGAPPPPPGVSFNFAAPSSASAWVAGGGAPDGTAAESAPSGGMPPPPAPSPSSFFAAVPSPGGAEMWDSVTNDGRGAAPGPLGSIAPLDSRARAGGDDNVDLGATGGSEGRRRLAVARSGEQPPPITIAQRDVSGVQHPSSLGSVSLGSLGSAGGMGSGLSRRTPASGEISDAAAEYFRETPQGYANAGNDVTM